MLKQAIEKISPSILRPRENSARCYFLCGGKGKRRMSKFTRIIVWVFLGLAALFFVFGIVGGCEAAGREVGKYYLYHWDFEDWMAAISAFITAFLFLTGGGMSILLVSLALLFEYLHDIRGLLQKGAQKDAMQSQRESANAQ